MSALSRNAENGLNKISESSEELGVPDEMKNKTFEIYRQVVENDVSGRSIDTICSASLLIASDDYGEPVDINELCSFFGVDEKFVYREKKRVKSSLNLEVSNLDVPSYIKKYSPTEEVEERAIELYQDSKDNGFQVYGKSRKGLAASAVYLAGLTLDESLTQSEIANMANVTEVTIRNTYQPMASHTSFIDQ
jgi:transcription initiation factor TFIIB